MKASDVIARVRHLLADTKDPYRWPDTELMLYVSDAQRHIVSLRPDAAYISSVTVPDDYSVPTVGTTLVIADAFMDAAVDYVCHRSIMKDAEHADNLKLAEVYEAGFAQKVQSA